jgi:hypothetical protein
MSKQVERYEPWQANAYLAGQQYAAQPSYPQVPRREVLITERQAHIVNGEVFITEREVYILEGENGQSWSTETAPPPVSWIDRILGVIIG